MTEALVAVDDETAAALGAIARMHEVIEKHVNCDGPTRDLMRSWTDCVRSALMAKGDAIDES